MARVTHVKSARQRFERVDVLGADGEAVRSEVTRKNGEQKLTKRGRGVTRKQTVADKSKPLPNRNCGKCGNEIKVGDPYKWIAPRSGPFGGRKLYRCASCPTWQVWEYSSSLSARTQQIEHNLRTALESVEDADGARQALTEAAEEVRSLAEEKRESAQNLEDGFQHPTEQSEELNGIAEELDGWADDLENFDVEDEPAAEDDNCTECDGTGSREPFSGEDYDEDDLNADGELECSDCSGTGHPDEVSEDSLQEWRDGIEPPDCPL